MSMDMPDVEMIAELNRIHKSDNLDRQWEYLCIETMTGLKYHGGSQQWWYQYAGDKPNWETAKKQSVIIAHAKKDECLRLVFLGCGVIAMVDLELYFCLSHPEFKLDPHGEFQKLTDAGKEMPYAAIKQKLYEEIVNYKWQKDYHIDGNIINLHVGLYPWKMEKGFIRFLKHNNSVYQKVKWAPYLHKKAILQKKRVLEKMIEMLHENLPVVCAYHTFDHNNGGLVLYRDLEDAHKNAAPSKQDHMIFSHYMTIIGIFRDERDQYYLKIVSWGIIFYTRFEEFSRNLNLFTNILMIA